MPAVSVAAKSRVAALYAVSVAAGCGGSQSLVRRRSVPAAVVLGCGTVRVSGCADRVNRVGGAGGHKTGVAAGAVSVARRAWTRQVAAGVCGWGGASARRVGFTDGNAGVVSRARRGGVVDVGGRGFRCDRLVPVLLARRAFSLGTALLAKHVVRGRGLFVSRLSLDGSCAKELRCVPTFSVLSRTDSRAVCPTTRVAVSAKPLDVTGVTCVVGRKLWVGKASSIATDSFNEE